eukprot:scaffold90145_cov35-Tisochrysis_lutea.AAC.3
MRFSSSARIFRARTASNRFELCLNPVSNHVFCPFSIIAEILQCTARKGNGIRVIRVEASKEWPRTTASNQLRLGDGGVGVHRVRAEIGNHKESCLHNLHRRVVEQRREQPHAASGTRRLSQLQPALAVRALYHLGERIESLAADVCVARLKEVEQLGHAPAARTRASTERGRKT